MAVAQAVEQSAPSLGPAGPKIGQLFEATAGQQGKVASQGAYRAGEGAAEEAVRAARTFSEIRLNVPALDSERAITLGEALRDIANLGKGAFTPKGTSRDTMSAAQMAGLRDAALDQVMAELEKKAPAAVPILKEARQEFANASAVRRIFKPNETGQGALDMGATTIRNMRDLQGRMIAQEARLSPGQYEGLAPLREALFRGGPPAQDVTRGIPLPWPARRYLPNQIPLWKSYAGTPLPNPSPMTLDLALRGMLGLGAP